MVTTPPVVPDTPSFIGQPTGDLVHFRVEVDRSRCLPVDPAINTRLQTLETNGLILSIAGIVARSAIHFMGAVLDAGEGHEIARVRLAWHLLMDWQMAAVPHHNNPNRLVLTVTHQPNSRLLALRTEIISVGIGLEVGIRMYDIPYPFWDATPGLQSYDLHTHNDAGEIIAVEVRGRTNRNGWSTAMQQIYHKFQNPNFSRGAGVIFFPRTTNRSRTSDIMIIDPEGDVSAYPPNQKYRALLRHYAPFFIAQGPLVRPFGERLRAVADSDEHAFEGYLRGGISVGTEKRLRRGHSGFTFGGIQYIGTFWDGVVWPYWLTGIRAPSDQGVFFWGLAVQVVDALVTGQLEGLRFPEEQTLIEKNETRMIILLSDLTVLVWAPSRELLDLAEDEKDR